MKCPVCGNVNKSMVCLRCGFDSSRDYGKYPAFGGVSRTPSVSGLRKQWEETGEKVAQVPAKRRKLLPLLIAAAFVLTLVLGIWIGTGFGSGSGESVQMQEPPETTNQTAPPETTEPDPPVQIIGAEPWRKNILRSDLPLKNEYGAYDSDVFPVSPVFGSEYRRDEIGSVHFLDTLADASDDAWDVSQAGDGTVLAWVIPSEGLYDLYIGAEGGVNAPQDCRGLFAGYENTQKIDFGDAFHTVNTLNMNWMFDGCKALTILNLSSFDTSKVQNMCWMFNNCECLTKLTLTNFDTSNVKDMQGMFQRCFALTKLNLSNFITSNVQNMSAMFDSCKALTELTLTSFDTSNVRYMDWMFNSCEALPKLNLSSFDTTNVQDMSVMFARCHTLTKLTLSERFVTTNADTRSMFAYCPAGADYQHLVH